MTCRTISITKSIEVCDSYPLLELTQFYKRRGEESKNQAEKISLKELTSAKELFLRR